MVFDDGLKFLGVSLPPSYGKSFITNYFSAWCYGLDSSWSILRLSYSDDLFEDLCVIEDLWTKSNLITFLPSSATATVKFEKSRKTRDFSSCFFFFFFFFSFSRLAEHPVGALNQHSSRFSRCSSVSLCKHASVDFLFPMKILRINEKPWSTQINLRFDFDSDHLSRSRSSFLSSPSALHHH